MTEYDAARPDDQQTDVQPQPIRYADPNAPQSSPVDPWREAIHAGDPEAIEDWHQVFDADWGLEDDDQTSLDEEHQQ